MKTPREILCQQHRAAEPELDAIRHKVVASTRRPSSLGWPILLWRELVWPSRRIWAGLAAVWVVIVTLNFSMQDRSQPTMAKTSPTPEMIQIWRQQERVLAELIGPNEKQVVRPPKPLLPQPSSERRFENLMT